MRGKLDIRIFAHSFVSDWNHGNAHFLRGLARSLMKMGHQVRAYEELGAWSLTNLVKQEQERSIDAIDDFRRRFKDLPVHFYRNDAGLADYLTKQLRGADVVIIHEWSEPKVVNTILSLKEQLGFRVLFHDTHHRAYTDAGKILRFHIQLFDGVLAFGEAIRRIYADGFGVEKVWTFHEAADVDSFYPLPQEKTTDVLWIGNWGDEERSRELNEFLIQPAAAAAATGRKVVVHGVRYPEHALKALLDAGIEYRGYLPNLMTPSAYAGSRISLHVPRQQYANGLSGIPTIRVFEALACGATVVWSPWEDVENLFRPGDDFVLVPNGKAMQAELTHLLSDEAACKQISANGLETIRQRHTCDHRAQQLTQICQELLG
jgi:spore maturation protein CgeB